MIALGLWAMLLSVVHGCIVRQSGLRGAHLGVVISSELGVKRMEAICGRGWDAGVSNHAPGYVVSGGWLVSCVLSQLFSCPYLGLFHVQFGCLLDVS